MRLQGFLPAVSLDPSLLNTSCMARRAPVVLSGAFLPAIKVQQWLGHLIQMERIRTPRMYVKLNWLVLFWSILQSLWFSRVLSQRMGFWSLGSITKKEDTEKGPKKNARIRKDSCVHLRFYNFEFETGYNCTCQEIYMNSNLVSPSRFSIVHMIVKYLPFAESGRFYFILLTSCVFSSKNAQVLPLR